MFQRKLNVFLFGSPEEHAFQHPKSTGKIYESKYLKRLHKDYIFNNMIRISILRFNNLSSFLIFQNPQTFCLFSVLNLILNLMWIQTFTNLRRKEF